ncbi:MAG TPA: hypothetical protein VFP33_11690, partial [Gallionella sp.]|nr:hypothetical protein [Gallionella sp.]
MKHHSWIRLALLIVAAVSIAMTSANSDQGAAVKKGSKSAAPHTSGTGIARHKADDVRMDAAAKELHVELERLARPEPVREGEQQAEEGGSRGVFGVTSWYVPPPPPPAQPPPPPPKPTAPPLPFSYLGRFQESESQTIMLVKGDRIYT